MAEASDSDVEERPVRRVLRRRDTHEYFKDNGWTCDPDDARNFTDILEAAELCVQRGLFDIELVLRVEAEEVYCTLIR